MEEKFDSERSFAKGEKKWLEESIKLIKSLFPDEVYFYPIDSSYVRISSVNAKDYFTHAVFIVNTKFITPELVNTLVKIPNIIEALKAKADKICVKYKKVHLINSETGKKFIIAAFLELAPNVLTHIENLKNDYLDKFFPYLYDDSEDAVAYDKIFTAADRIQERLLNYEVITARPETADDIAMIFTNKCFPNVKKMESLEIRWFPCVSGESELVAAVIHAKYLDGKILFDNTVLTLKC